ncbi:hypothetical protein V1506DRAFT_46832 [Lipomyces tetrasporus]
MADTATDPVQLGTKAAENTTSSTRKKVPTKQAAAAKDIVAEKAPSTDDAQEKVKTLAEDDDTQRDSGVHILSEERDEEEEEQSKEASLDVGDEGDADIEESVADTADNSTEKADDVESNVGSATDDAAEAADGDDAVEDVVPAGKVIESGEVIDDEGNVLGKINGDINPSEVAGSIVTEEGEVLDDDGNIIGTASPTEEVVKALEEAGAEDLKEQAPLGDEAEGEKPEQKDFSVAEKKVDKMCNIVDDNGRVVGHVVEGILKHLAGKKVDDEAQICGGADCVIGRAEQVSEDEREEAAEPAPFEDFPDAVVDKSGNVTFPGQVVGKLIESDANQLAGKKVDLDGDVIDKSGNVLGKAERYDEGEPEPEVDNSVLAGRKVNMAGNVANNNGEIYGRVIKGDGKALAGKMFDKNGLVRNESGDVIGKAEKGSEGSREGMKEGPFSAFPDCKVTKEEKVTDTASGEVVGRVVEGDSKTLYGKSVDDDGGITDKNGNLLGMAERWEEEEAKKDVKPMCGRKVNIEGNVVDENGDPIGKPTSGDLRVCAGKKVDDGDVVKQKGNIIDHVSLLNEIKEPEPEPEEEKQKREEMEHDKKLGNQMAAAIDQCLDKVNPVLKMLDEALEKAERTPKVNLDEEELVNQVRPLIEEGGNILQEANGAIRGMDPDDRIQANAKARAETREATPEEYRLAEKLKDLTGKVTYAIDKAKKRISGMPHANKELNPLWGLLSEPLFQILAAVGLLLSGVLGLVAKLLSGLGLGGLVDNLLGGLGLKPLLGGLGLGDAVGALTRKKSKK